MSFNPTPIKSFSDLRDGLPAEIAIAINNAIFAAATHERGSAVSVTFKVKRNKSGTAIEVVDRIRVKTPVGQRKDVIDTSDPWLAVKVDIEDEGQQRLPA